MKSLFYLNKYFVKYKWRLLLGFCFVVISNIFALFPARIIREGFDKVGEVKSEYDAMATGPEKELFFDDIYLEFVWFGLLIIGLALAKGFFTFMMRQTIIVMSRLIEYDLKNEIFDQYQSLSLAFYKRNKTGDLMNRISEDVSRVRMYLGPAIMYTINLSVLFIMVISVMLTVNVKLTLFVLLPLPILAISIYKVSSIINKKSDKVQRKLSDLSSIAQETFSGIRILKAYNRTTSKQGVFDAETEEYKDVSLDLVKVNALFQPLMILLIGTSTALTIYVGGRLVIAGEITTGNIAEFIIYVNMLTWPVAALGWVTSLVQRAAASQTRINEFLEKEPEIQNTVSDKTPLEGEIAFKNVNFIYPDSGIQALKDVSFNLQQGKSLAIIGKTGSGKSTIADLLVRLYDVTDGSITVGGRDLREFNLNALRRQIGYVPQEVFLFSDTIAKNIAFGSEVEFNQSTIEQAAKDAVVYSNIKEFPRQFETRLGERGVTLSGGQKQRISIARAIIKTPHLLIFDDSLSAVDTETEEQILSNLKGIMKDRSSVFISHRVSTVRHCDHIIVLRDGEITEQGTHEQLVKNEELYHELNEQQMLEQQKQSKQVKA